MNVCFVTHLPNLYGANKSLLDMLDGMSGSEVVPFVLVNGAGPLVEELKKRKIQYKIIRYSPATNSDNFIKNAGKFILNSSIPYGIALRQIKAFLAENKIDLVHNNTYLVGIGMHAASELGIPFICHIREMVWEGHHRRFFRDELQKSLLNKASCRIAISEAVKRTYQKDTKGEITVINDGIKINEYRLPLRKILTKDKVRILLAGRISGQKGQLEAVMAAEELVQRKNVDVELLIVGSSGDSEYTQKLRDYVASKKLEYVRFIDYTSDLRRLRESCDIGLSCSRDEALGRVTIENMMSSLLVISSDDEAAKEIIKAGETGMLYEAGSYRSLANALEKAISDPKLSNRLVENAYASVERFDHIAYGNKIVSLYRSILGSIT